MASYSKSQRSKLGLASPIKAKEIFGLFISFLVCYQHFQPENNNIQWLDDINTILALIFYLVLLQSYATL